MLAIGSFQLFHPSCLREVFLSCTNNGSWSRKDICGTWGGQEADFLLEVHTASGKQ